LLRQEASPLTDFLDVIQGTLDLLVLKALALGPVHAWGIGARIAELSGEQFQLGQGSLYPALAKLEGLGAVKAATTSCPAPAGTRCKKRPSGGVATRPRWAALSMPADAQLR